MDGTSIGIIISILSFAVGLAAWLIKLGRWQGRLESKLNHIADLKEDVEGLKTTVKEYGHRLTIVETKCELRYGAKQPKEHGDEGA